MTDSALPAGTPAPSTDRPREVRFEYSRNLPAILAHLRISLLVSTYHAGKMAVIGSHRGELRMSFHNFEQAMGVAVSDARIAVAGRQLIWMAHSAPALAPQLEPAGQFDACYLTRSAHVTGNIQTHDMSWAGNELWLVNTSFSCLCTLHPDFSFVPRWKPPFISALVSQDRCHLNGLALADGKPRYVTALAETDTPEGWRPDKVSSGCLIDVPTGRTVLRGLCMPHSPRIFQNRTWLLDSGTGRLLCLTPGAAGPETVCSLDGYTRGLALHANCAFVGLSRIRETATFGGVPVADRRDQLRCGVAVVELGRAQPVAHLDFHTGVEEIFDVQVVPDRLCPRLMGPYPDLDDTPPIWLAPELRS